MFKIAAFILMGVLFASAARADRLMIVNNTGEQVYAIYAWPTILTARTFNILGSPIVSGDQVAVEIDNPYNDCDFTIQYDVNNPKKLKTRFFRKKLLGMIEKNICATVFDMDTKELKMLTNVSIILYPVTH